MCVSSKWCVGGLLCLIFWSCNKHGDNPPQEYKSSIKSSGCSINKTDDYKFEAVIAGNFVCFDKIQNPIAFRQDRWFTINKNFIACERTNIDTSLSIRLYYDYPSFISNQLPFMIDTAQNVCENARIEIINWKPVKMCECRLDDWNYVGSTRWGNMTCIIYSFTDSVLVGEFFGEFYNAGGAIEGVKIPVNGHFKIKVRAE